MPSKPASKDARRGRASADRDRSPISESGKPAAGGDLRHRAEERLRTGPAERDSERTEADTQRLLHELQVHQVELELQNEELRRARNELEASFEKYSDLYEFAPVSYLTLDREGTIREANLTSAHLLGMERSWLVRRPFASYLAGGSLPVFSAWLPAVFASETRESCELTIPRNGRPPVEARIEAMVTASRQECRAAVTDITEHIRAEQDRLTLGKLESSSILAGGIAHDFNNLLTVILLDMELALTLAGPEPAPHDPLREALEATLTARTLGQQRTSFAAGGSSLRRPTHLTHLIRESVQLALSGSRVTCSFALAPDLRPVNAAPDQIGQLIRNLVLNAREAMPDGGLVVVRSDNRPSGCPGIPSLRAGPCVHLSIADEGGGIAREVLPNSMAPYFSTKERDTEKGMGLGLSICHTIVRKHGGAITVESEPGLGTTVHVHLPACDSAPDAPAPAPPGRRTSAVHPSEA